MEILDILEDVYSLIKTSEYGDKVKLIGNFALINNLKNYPLNFYFRSVTKDIDFDISISNVKNYIKDFSKILSRSNKYNFVVTNIKDTTKYDNAKILFDVYNKNNQLIISDINIDIEYKDRLFYTETEALSKVQDIEHAFVTKIMIETQDDTARRIKDLLDVYKILNTVFVNGITKGYILDLMKLYDKQFIHPTVWCEEKTVERHIKSVNKIIQKENLIKLNAEDIVYTFQNLIFGLIDNRLNNDAIFLQGRWWW